LQGEGLNYLSTKPGQVKEINVEPKNELAIAKAIKEIVENQDLYKK